MIRRSQLHETLTALTLGACLFIALGGDAAGLHSCPHHDAVPGQAAGGAASGAAHAAHAGSTDAHRSGGTHDHHGPCTCVGTCHASAAAPVPSAGGTHSVNTGGPSGHGDRPERDGFRVVTLPYILPYANAPPTAS